MAVIQTTDLSQIVYRASSLKYHSKALSPAGARKTAGRFNREGVSVLYLACDAQTALAEYWGTGPHNPVVLLSVRLGVKNLVDLTKAHKRWPGDWKNWESDWESALSLPVPDCPSWRCGDDAIRRKAGGIYFPSQKRPGGFNVAFFPEDAVIGTWSLTLIDPFGEIATANPVTV